MQGTVQIQSTVRKQCKVLYRCEDVLTQQQTNVIKYHHRSTYGGMKRKENQLDVLFKYNKNLH